jgi:APA family basic amino acid/polyamine antiporter
VKRPLRFPSLLALGVNGIVGVGIFFAPKEVAGVLPGWQGLSAYVAVTILLLPTGLVFARLGRAFPEDGGPYLYARAAFGARAAFAVGWITYVSALFSTAAVLVGLVDATAESIGVASPALRLSVEIALLSLLMGTLSRGLRLSAIMWTVVTVLKSLPLVALPLAALVARSHAPVASPPHVEAQGRLLAAALPVVFALQGFEVVPLPAAQVEEPARNVPIATVASLVFAGALYVALHAACLVALPDLASHDLPLADAASVFGGATLRSVIVAATSVSALGVVIGMLAMTPRYLAPLGTSDALGFRLDEQSPRAVPLRAFAVTYVLLFAMLAANAVWGSVGHLLALASLSVTLQYGVTAAALFALASRGENGLSPRDRWSAPFVLLSCALFLFGASALEIPIVLGMLALGAVARAFRRAPGVAV